MQSAQSPTSISKKEHVPLQKNLVIYKRNSTPPSTHPALMVAKVEDDS